MVTVVVPQWAANPEVVNCRADVHDPVPCPIPLEPAGLLDDMEPFDAPDGMFHHDSALADIPVEPLLHFVQRPVAGFLERHDDVHPFRFMALETAVLSEPGARRVRAGLPVGDLLVVHCPEIGRAQVDNVLVVLAVDLVLVGMDFFFPLNMAFWAGSSTGLGMACSTTSWLMAPARPKRSRKPASALP